MAGSGTPPTDEGQATSPLPPFSVLLRRRREQAGLSQLALAKAVGVNSGYISRLEAGERVAPTREMVDSVAAALGLPETEANQLVASAGFLPAALSPFVSGDPTLALVARLLARKDLSTDDLMEFREIVRLVARRWLPDA